MSRELLIVVDVQNGFVNRHTSALVEPLSRFVKKWVDQGRPTIFTRFINKEGSQWEQLIHWTRLRTAPETDLHPELEEIVKANKRNVQVCDKDKYSSLTDEVRGFLASHQVERVLLCGIATDGCVLKTAVDLFEMGLVPIVLKDLCSSHAGPDVHEAGILLIGRFIGRDQLIDSKDCGLDL